MNQQFFVYILTNRLHTVLHTGVTNNLIRRVYEHHEKLVQGFTSRYQGNRLVYYETSDDVCASITREKQIKAGSRGKKLALIADMNPEWCDLYEGLTQVGPQIAASQALLAMTVK
jgi:putative endonuclease